MNTSTIKGTVCAGSPSSFTEANTTFNTLSTCRSTASKICDLSLNTTSDALVTKCTSQLSTYITDFRVCIFFIKSMPLKTTVGCTKMQPNVNRYFLWNLNLVYISIRSKINTKKFKVLNFKRIKIVAKITYDYFYPLFTLLKLIILKVDIVLKEYYFNNHITFN